MEYTEYHRFTIPPLTKEAKARNELETNRLMSDRVKRKNTELQQEMEELDRRRRVVNDRLLQNGREIRSYADRNEKLNQFLALAEEI